MITWLTRHGQIAARERAKKRQHLFKGFQLAATLGGYVQFRKMPRIEQDVLLGWIFLAFIEFESGGKREAAVRVRRIAKIALERLRRPVLWRNPHGNHTAVKRSSAPETYWALHSRRRALPLDVLGIAPGRTRTMVDT